jgi:hypothetical protein
LIFVQHFARDADMGGSEGHVRAARMADGRTHFERDRPRERLSTFEDQRMYPVEKGRTRLYRQGRKRGKRGAGGRCRGIDVGGGARGDFRDSLLRRWIDERDRLRVR